MNPNKALWEKATLPKSPLYCVNLEKHSSSLSG
jgi:hypothetical protein